MRVYLTGADGMLGTALRAAIERAVPEWSVHGVSVRDFDIGDSAAVHRSVGAVAPDVVVHTAANAVVDDCETDPRRGMRVNVAGTHHVARACRATGSRLLFISSDYVFDGLTTPPGGYREDDVPNPVSVYGLSKLGGEHIAATVPDHLVVRTSWLYGGTDPRLDPVLGAFGQLRDGIRPRLITDQWSSPTYVADLADALVRLLPPTPDSRGTLHVANTGRASWYEVGSLVAEHVGVTVGVRPMPTAVDEAEFVGARPRDSHLDSGRYAALGAPMPHWADALARCLSRLTAGVGSR